MPYNINEIVKAPLYMNTGLNRDYLVPDFPYMIMLIPKGKQFTKTECDTAYATLNALLSATNEQARGYPMGPFVGYEDKSEEALRTTNATGGTTYVRHGKRGWLLEYDKGGMNMEQVYTFFHDNQDAYDCIIYDRANNGFIGTKPTTNTSNYVFKGFTLEQIEVPGAKWNDGSNATTHRIGIYFDNPEEFRKGRFTFLPVQEGTDIMQLTGLKNLEFNLHTPMSAGVIKFRLTTGMGATDLYDLYATSLVALTANFTFKDATNVTITCTVSAEAATKTIVCTFSGGAFTGLASGAKITGYSPAIPQLTAGGIPGYANTAWTMEK